MTYETRSVVQQWSAGTVVLSYIISATGSFCSEFALHLREEEYTVLSTVSSKEQVLTLCDDSHSIDGAMATT